MHTRPVKFKRLLAAGLLICCSWAISFSQDAGRILKGAVVGVPDGQSLIIESEGKEVKVRLAGIGAPVSIDELAKSSRDNLASLVQGKVVRALVLKSGSADAGHELLAKVSLESDDVALLQISNGFALSLKGSEFPLDADTRYMYVSAERGAFDSGRGLLDEKYRCQASPDSLLGSLTIVSPEKERSRDLAHDRWEMVFVQVDLDEAGDVTSATATCGLWPFRDAATKAALGAKFTPATIGGKPVKVKGTISYRFVEESEGERATESGG